MASGGPTQRRRTRGVALAIKQADEHERLLRAAIVGAVALVRAERESAKPARHDEAPPANRATRMRFKRPK